jgi:hypothetical protein
LTGAPGFTNHWGNLTGRFSSQGLVRFPVQPGERFDFARYPVATSDILPQLLHEHQAGFVNRVVEASYRARTYLHASHGQLNAEQAEELDKQARIITRYLLFADEAPWPIGSVDGDAAFKSDFLRNRKVAAEGLSLKDLDLATRLFKHRCSYMIYSSIFEGLPSAMKERIYQGLGAALRIEKPVEEYAYLPVEEKRAIRRILRETMAGLPNGW